MKKLVIGALALIAVSAMAVESENIVGYYDIPVPAGYSMVTPTFKTISSAPYDIQDIKVAGTGLSGDGDVMIQLISDEGEWVGEYWYYTKIGYNVAKDGWYDIDDEYVEDVGLDHGCGVFVSCDNEDVVFKVYGEVVQTAAANEVFEGYTISGNSSLAEVDLQDIVVSGTNLSGDGDVMIQLISDEGEWVGEYWYYTKTGYNVAKNGWYDIDDEYAEDVSLGAGFGFFVSSDNADIVFTVPSALTPAGN